VVEKGARVAASPAEVPMARTAAELYRLHAAQGKGDKEISTIVELLAGK
jgi:3-hydroxyisobutyrate dehydrogenase-like beta-hydroxyacid dehydrogenase